MVLSCRPRSGTSNGISNCWDWFDELEKDSAYDVVMLHNWK